MARRYSITAMSDDLVLLVSCADGLEAAQVRSLLESEGIAHVVQGEHHSTMLGGTAMLTPIDQRVLVREGDLQQARALLEARPKLDGGDGPTLDGAVCPVHEQPARATCARCGTFLCAACQTLGEPPVCESCVAAEQVVHKKRWHPELALLIPLAMLIGVVLLMQYLGVVPD